MALVFETQYTLNFDSKQGEDITWELDILESYDDSGSRPAHFVDTPIPLIGASEPIVIEYERDYDVYKPIQGSTASINLVAEQAGQYADFSNGSPYQYQVRLRYKSGGDPAKGAQVTDAGGTPLTFAAETGTRIADRFTSGQISVRINAGDKATTVPVLDSSNEGRWVYVSNDGGATVVPIGTIRSTEYTSATRIQLFDTKGYGSDAALDTALDGYGVGAEFWLADEGDTGDSTTLAATPETLQPFWCGFFSPLDASEAVTSFPYEISFTAVDGLGLLEESTPEEASSTGQVNAFQTFLVPALQQTGLGLNIHVDSGILDSDGDDGLLTATTDNQSRYKDLDGSGELFTQKELLEGYLAAWNCKITQANGRWYIYNASSLSDTPTWKVFNSQGIAQADVTESLVKTIDGTTAQDLVPAFNDFQLNLRRPAGSIECNPKDLVERQFSINGNFGAGDSTGWNILNITYANVAEFSPADNGYALRVNRSFGSKDTLLQPNGNLPVQRVMVNTPGYELDPVHEIEVKFDHRWTKIRTTGRSYFRVRATFTTQQYLEVSSAQPTLMCDPNSPGYYECYSQQWAGANYINSTSVEELYWDSELSEWTMNEFNGFTQFDQEDENVWANESQTLASLSGFFGDKREITNVMLFIEFYGSHDTTFLAGTSLTNQEYWIDNISVKNNFSGDITSPTFERVQTNFVHTIQYEPLFSSSTSDAIYQKLFPTMYGRRDKVGESATLEQIGTQQKLNDFRDQFKYYEGSLINLDNTPLTNINKVSLNWAADNYVETSSGIMNGGSFRVKSNVFDTAFYIPHQVGLGLENDDHPSEYFTQNVNLIRAKFPGRSELVTYTLAFKVSTTDENGVSEMNGLVPTQPFITFTALPGSTQTYKLNLVPKTGFIGSSSTTTITANSDSTPTPLYTSVGAIGYNQGNLEIPLTVTMPVASEFEELYISGGITTFEIDTANEIISSITMNHSIASSGGATGSIATASPIVKNVSGLGAAATDVVFEIDAGMGNLILTADQTGVHNIDGLSVSPVVTGLGTQVARLTYSYVRPNTSPTSAQIINVNGTFSTISAFELNGITKNLSITNANNDVSINDGTTSGNVTTIPFHGFDGDVIYRGISLVPNSDKLITGVTNSYLTPSTITSAGAIVQSSENWEVPIFFELDGTSSVSTTINISTSDEPYSVTCPILAIGQNFVIEGATLGDPVQELIFTFDDGDLGGDINQTFYLRPVDGYMWNSSQATPEILVGIDEEAGGFYTNADGNNVQVFNENDWTGTVQTTLDTNGRLQVAVVGKLPARAGSYVLPIQVAGNPANGGGATVEQQPTSVSTTIRSLSTGISSAGGTATFELVSDGAWHLQHTVTATGIGGTSVSITGGETGTSGVINAPVTFSLSGQPDTNATIRGSYSPTYGGAGTHLITLQMDEEFGQIEALDANTTVSSFFGNISVKLLVGTRPFDSSAFEVALSPEVSDSVDQSHLYGGRSLFVDLSNLTGNYAEGEVDGIISGYSALKPSWSINTNYNE